MESEGLASNLRAAAEAEAMAKKRDIEPAPLVWQDVLKGKLDHLGRWQKLPGRIG
jgi:hypothetical protein